MPTPPRWPSGLSEPHPGVCAPPGAGSSRAGAAGSPMAPIPRSQPELAWAPAGPSTPPLKPVCSKLFTPLGWDRQSRTGGAPGCSHGGCRGCSPPGLGTWAPAPPNGSSVPFRALLLAPLPAAGLGQAPGLAGGGGLTLVWLLGHSWQRLQPCCPGVLRAPGCAGRGSTERPFPFLRPSPFPNTSLSPSPRQPGSTESLPCPPSFGFGGLLSASPAPPGPTEPLPAATPVQFPFIIPRSHSREVH